MIDNPVGSPTALSLPASQYLPHGAELVSTWLDVNSDGNEDLLIRNHATGQFEAWGGFAQGHGPPQKLGLDTTALSQQWKHGAVLGTRRSAMASRP